MRPEWAKPNSDSPAPLRLDRAELLTYFEERAASREDGGMSREEASAAATADVIEAIRDGRIKPLGAGAVEAVVTLARPEPSVSPYLAGKPGEWQRAFLGLDHGSEPAPGIRKWPSVRRAVLHFLEHHGEAAVALGWTELDLFAVHPVVGAVRGDCVGALLTSGGNTATEITADLIRFSSGLAYRRHAWPPGITLVPVWEFGR